MISYKFRLYPTKKQQEKLWLHANKLNYLYNYFLAQRITKYENEKVSINKSKQQIELVTLKKNDLIIKEIHSQVLQQVTLRLDNAFKKFFKTKIGFPKFRSCRNFFNITYPQKGYNLTKNYITTKVYGKIKFIKHRNIEGNIKQVTITCQDNQWYLIIVTDFQIYSVSNGIVGIDLGITNLVATSNEEIIKNQTHSKYFDKQINRLKSKRDTNIKKGSRRYKFLSNVINKLYGVKSRKVNDFLHKVSKNLSNKYDTIIIEDLNLKEMSEGNKVGINRELRNSCLATFVSYLTYKTSTIIKVNPYNTSKTCNSCGKIHDIYLSIRIMDCECGNKIDRDINAAKNIYCLGQAFLETGCIGLTIQEAISFRE